MPKTKRDFNFHTNKLQVSPIDFIHDSLLPVFYEPTFCSK